MDELFPNRESAWHAEREAATPDREEVFRRIGAVQGPITRLSGGLANESLLIGADRVLRIYRRNVAAMDVERALLEKNWSEFRVPRVLESGEDFLVLEYVPHGPLLNQEEHGEAVGRGLAEIHRQSFSSHGPLGAGLQIVEPWEDFPRAIEEYFRSLRVEDIEDARLIERVLERFSRLIPELQEACGRPVLLHGDFKASNLHWREEGRLLVLDWEFAYAGPALMDVGQLVRWGIPQPFSTGFERGYSECGGDLQENWQFLSGILDLLNLTELYLKSSKGSAQAGDCLRKIEATIKE